MELNDSIDAWCKQQNRQNGTAKAFVLLFGGAGIAGLLAYFLNTPFLYIFSGSACLLWIMVAPKPASLQRYLYTDAKYASAPSVPDSLLSHIADDANVPAWVKSELAERLERNPEGRLSFRDLFELDAAIMADATRRQASTAEGFTKLNAFRTKGGD